MAFNAVSNENKTVTRVEYLERVDREDLNRMLASEEDFPQHLPSLYQRQIGPDENLVAWRRDRIEGLLTATFRHDFSDNRDFSEFSVPRAPHALLSRIHVRHGVRNHGAGRASVARFATEATKNGCDLLGGYVDETSEPTGRIAFFERLGFIVGMFNSFGARAGVVLSAAAA